MKQPLVDNQKVLSIKETDKIIRRMKDDDKSALDDLFHYFYPRLYHFSKALLKMEREIDDLLQEVFIKIWLNRQKINNAESFSAWLFTITKNELLNLIRTNLKEKSFREELFLHAVAEEYQSLHSIEYEEIRIAIEKITASLPEKRQIIFKLSRVEGLSNKAIAQKLSISEKTVEDHITHSIRHIKCNLRNMGILLNLYFYLFF